ncbi:MAG: DUF3037 domain-containing protein [Akkermansiaceae bacterium]|nr:DUF3037 domain-containing protein [Akkermansiaceae bacterium]MCP5542719.1 DUF3037 domain-containing protein [Akkermansiaceae bacterium]MCP5548678.1 DUF3037 domain-containing protein [Akkermansiaceae bacterium]
MNAPTTGYYCLIQYCPDRGRLEAANIGVLLFCPDSGYLRARLSSGNERIRNFFGDEAGDLKQINAMKKMLEHRLEAEKSSITGLEDLRRFAALLANEIVVTPPRTTFVEEPDVELAQLFEDLVARTQRKEPPAEATLVNRLRERLGTPRLKALVREDVTVKVPVLGQELTVPFTYQNGRLNLIEAHEFNQRREQDIVRDLLTKAAQGRLIYKHPDPEAGERQLVIVAAFGQAACEYRDRVAEVLRDHDVGFFDESAFDQLEKQIIETAH